MPKITFKDHQGNSKTIDVDNGLSVMEGAIQKEIPGIDADCGGSMACATCHVYVSDEWINKISKPEDADKIPTTLDPAETVWNLSALLKNRSTEPSAVNVAHGLPPPKPVHCVPL